MNVYGIQTEVCKSSRGGGNRADNTEPVRSLRGLSLSSLSENRRGAVTTCKTGGFTLIEVIVVLVILAILAAIAIPALTGYIDKAEQRAAIADVREMHTALQAMVMQDYADKRLVLNGGDPNREIHYYGNSSNASSVTIGGKDYYNVYIEYGRGDSSNASPSFPHLLAYLGADAPPGLPADCNYAQLRFLVALDGSIAALDYVTYNNNKSGKIPKTRITWNYNGADANISEVVLKNYLNHIDDSGYVVRYFNGKLISGVKPN